MSEDQWYVLYVRSRHEKSVWAQLESKAHEVFLPLYRSRQKWTDRWKTVSLPLFPGYVFCRFNSQERSSVLTTAGVIDVVRAGSQPAAIESHEIEAIQRVVESQLPVEPYELIQGEPVMMSEGPLKGLCATLVEIRNGVRLVVSVELLRRSVLVEIDRDWVIPRRFSQPFFVQSYLSKTA